MSHLMAVARHAQAALRRSPLRARASPAIGAAVARSFRRAFELL